MRSSLFAPLVVLFALVAVGSAAETCCDVNKILDKVSQLISVTESTSQKGGMAIAESVVKSITKQLEKAYYQVSDQTCEVQIHKANKKTVEEANHMLCLLRTEIKHMKADAADFRSKAFAKILSLQTTIHTEVTRRHMAEYRYRSAVKSYKWAKIHTIAARKAARKAKYLASQVVAFARRETKRRMFAERSARRSRRSAKIARRYAYKYKVSAYRNRRAARRARRIAMLYRRKASAERRKRYQASRRYSNKWRRYARRYRGIARNRRPSRRCNVFHKYIYHVGLRQLRSLHRDQRHRRMWAHHAWSIIRLLKNQARLAASRKHKALLLNWHAKLTAMHRNYLKTYFNWNKACLTPFKTVAKKQGNLVGDFLKL